MALGFAFAVCGKKGRGRTTHLSRVSLREREAGPSPPPHPRSGGGRSRLPLLYLHLKIVPFFQKPKPFSRPDAPLNAGAAAILHDEGTAQAWGGARGVRAKGRGAWRRRRGTGGINACAASRRRRRGGAVAGGRGAESRLPV